MPIKTTRFDVRDHLQTPELRRSYIIAAFEFADAEFIRDSLEIVSRLVGMPEIARLSGVELETLYEELGAGGDPVLGVTKALGLQLTVQAIE